jgi:serine/threonine-protein kinase
MPEIIERLTTALSDRYQIDHEIGAGGMATVYLAHDIKHDRKVALKVLLPELAAVIGAERFLQEIKVTANLQHPHILQLYDSGEADTFLFYVMPFVEGETLRDKLNREKQLAIDEAIEITVSIAAALDYAHRHEVIHRDIKPENILLHDGQAMVADFGIALAVSEAGATRLTETGLSIGTPQYMSPEQAMGDRQLDARSDVYSLSAVLYEMLTGDPPYTGSTAQAIVAKVITEKPPEITAVRDTVPPHVADAIHQALAKLPADRFPTAAGFAEALKHPGLASVRATSASAVPVPQTRALPLWSLAAVALVFFIVGGAVGWFSRPDAPVRVERFRIFEGMTPDFGVAISPDGSTVVASMAGEDGIYHLFLRSLDQLEPRMIPGTDDGQAPTFSPDGRDVAFVARGGLWRVSITGAPPIMVADTGISLFPLMWGQDGNIYFTTRTFRSMSRIAADGGVAEEVWKVDSEAFNGFTAHPHLLPNGKGLIVTLLQNTEDQHQVGVLDLETGDLRTLTTGMSGKYSPSGHLFYATSNGTLLAAEFDQDKMELTGPARPVAQDLWQPGFGTAFYSLASDGTLLYQVGGGQLSGSVLSLVDREGNATQLPTPPGAYNAIALSPDGTRLAVETISGSSDGGDIHILAMGDSILARLTFQSINTYPAWSADGRYVAFSRELEDVNDRDIYWQLADGSGMAEPLLERPGIQFEVQFAPDGDHVLLREGNASVADNLDLTVTRMAALDQAERFPTGAGTENRAPKISPDGRWVAYVSNESGTDEVYVRPFPDASSGAVWQVSTEGGTEPMWAHSGRELFYKSAVNLMVAEVRTDPSFAVRGRRPLFRVGQYLSNVWHARYEVFPDDQGFIMIQTSSGIDGLETVVVRNWEAEMDAEAGD